MNSTNQIGAPAKLCKNVSTFSVEQIGGEKFNQERNQRKKQKKKKKQTTAENKWSDT